MAGGGPDAYRWLMRGNGRLIFRPRVEFSLLTGAAALFWCSVLLYLLRFDGLPAQTLGSAALMAGFFIVMLVYYARTAITVDEGGLTFRGMVRKRRYEYSEIRRLEVLQGPISVYAVRTEGRPVHFTSFFRHHDRLMRLLLERAELESSRR